MWTEEQVRRAIRNVNEEIARLEALDDVSFLLYYAYKHRMLVALRDGYELILDDSKAPKNAIPLDLNELTVRAMPDFGENET